MKKTFGRQAMRIMAAALVVVLLMVPMASGEQSAWDCPECGRTGNLWNYCGNCAHPAPWTKEEGFDEEKAYDAVLKQIEEIKGDFASLNSSFIIKPIGTTSDLSAFQSKMDELISDNGIMFWHITNKSAANIGLTSAVHLGFALKYGNNILVIAFRLNGAEIKVIQKSNGTWGSTWKTYSGT